MKVNMAALVATRLDGAVSIPTLAEIEAGCDLFMHDAITYSVPRQLF